MQPRDHIIDELATTDNFHVVAYHKERVHNSRDTYELSRPMTRVIQNEDNTFKMRIDITVTVLLCERLPEPEEDHNGDIYEKAYEPAIDGPLDEDQEGHTLLCFSLGFGIHIDIADISPRAGKSKFYSQNDYACYAWEDFYNNPVNVNRILKVIEQRPYDQRPGVHSLYGKQLPCRPILERNSEQHVPLHHDSLPRRRLQPGTKQRPSANLDYTNYWDGGAHS